MTGYLATRQMRAVCPECQRNTAGGWAGDPEHRYIILHKHKVPGRHPGRPWCTAGKTKIEAQQSGGGR